MIDGVRKVEAFPHSRELLPNEIAVQIGCIGCTAECTGAYILQAGREDRDTITTNVRAASELSGIPSAVMIGSRVISSEGPPTKVACLDGSQPCTDPDMIGLFEFGGFKIHQVSGQTV